MTQASSLSESKFKCSMKSLTRFLTKTYDHYEAKPIPNPTPNAAQTPTLSRTPNLTPTVTVTRTQTVTISAILPQTFTLALTAPQVQSRPSATTLANLHFCFIRHNNYLILKVAEKKQETKGKKGGFKIFFEKSQDAL